MPVFLKFVEGYEIVIDPEVTSTYFVPVFMPELTSQSEEKSNCPIRGQKVLFCLRCLSRANCCQHGGAGAESSGHLMFYP